jgi:hypothetical protein
MTLLDCLAALPGALPPPSEPVRLHTAVEEIRTAYPAVRPVEPKELSEIIGRIDAALRSWDWGIVKEGEIAIAVKAYAARAPEMTQPVALFLRRELAQTTRATLLSALSEGYIAGWMPADRETRWMQSIIVARAAWLPREWQQRFVLAPALLDPEEGHREFGHRLATEPDPFRAAQELGISAPHGPGFMRHVHMAWLAALPEAVDDSTVDRILRWIVPSGAPKLDDDRAAAAVARLLNPWQRRMPPPNLRAKLVKAIVGAYGDLRKENSHFWHQVGDAGRRVVLRWLAGQRMEAFLEVVSRAEAQGDFSAQWAARRRFWMGMFQNGRIDDAWASYSKAARAIAVDLYRKTDDAAFREHARQIGSRKTTCLLIMQVGEFVVVEGSHNLRVHIFRATDQNAPKLHADRYDVEEFLLPTGHPDARMHDAAGNWMTWVQDRVR